MFNPYDESPLISNREADLGDVEVHAPLSLQEIAKLVPVFFAAGRKQRAFNDARGLQDVGTDEMLIGMHAVLVAEDRVEDANVLGKYANWLRVPERFGGLDLIEYKALSDPKVKAVVKRIHGNRYAQELSRRADGKLIHRDSRAASAYWNICADEEASVGNTRASMVFRQIAKSRAAVDLLELPVHTRLLDVDGKAPQARRTSQRTIKADRFIFDEYRDYMTRLNGRTWEQAEADFAERDNSDTKMDVHALHERIRRAELRRAGKR